MHGGRIVVGAVDITNLSIGGGVIGICKAMLWWCGVQQGGRVNYRL